MKRPALLVFLFFALGFSVEKPMWVGAEKLAVYKNQKRKLYENPAFQLAAGDKVFVLEKHEGRVKIRDGQGREGWVLGHGLSANKQNFLMKEIEIHGFFDHAEPIYILDFDNEGIKPIRVAKNFVFDPNFMYNIVRENFEWENEIYYYKDYHFKPVSAESKVLKKK